MTRNRKITIVRYGIFVVVLFSLYIYFTNINQHFLAIQSFDACVLAGYPVSATYPEVCTIPGKKFTNPNQQAKDIAIIPPTQTGTTTQYKNISYTIEGESVSLHDGVFMLVDKGTSASTTIHYYGNELFSDYNNDGTTDVAGILQVSPSGTGVFYYIVIAFKKEDGYIGGRGVYVGDRILPISITKEKNGVTVTYKDRSVSEPMIQPPHLTVTKYVSLEKLLP
jgi:hypothetical protein